VINDTVSRSRPKCISAPSFASETLEDQELTTGEFNLLEAFVKRAHRVLSRSDIMDLLKDHD
jgi:DNA-binding winged helix-turn-helix (wHTH) protein